MKTQTILRAALLSAAVAVSATVHAKPLKVLMIGNSFSVSVMKHIPSCAASAGETLDIASLMIGGCPLEKHWNNVEKAGDPEFKPYSFSYSYASVKNPKDAPVAKLGPKRWQSRSFWFPLTHLFGISCTTVKSASVKPS